MSDNKETHYKVFSEDLDIEEVFSSYEKAESYYFYTIHKIDTDPDYQFVDEYDLEIIKVDEEIVTPGE